MRIPPALIAPAIHCVYRAWCGTLRISEAGRAAVDALEQAGTPMLFCLWHDELFALMHVRRSLRIVTLVSRSRDGEYLARLLQALGLLTARGSSSRGGVAALLRAARLMREERCNGCLTVDGPRGPRHVVKEGAIFLASRTPAHIVPVRLFMRKAQIFRSWDRFQLPLPFSSVRIVFGEPYRISEEKLEAEALERERLTLQERLEALRPEQ